MKLSELHRLILKNGWKQIRQQAAITFTKRMAIGTRFLIMVHMKLVRDWKRKSKERWG